MVGPGPEARRLSYDCIIVGAGPAGLSAALMLGRCRRRVLVCDAGSPRNGASRAVHGYLTREGSGPAEFLRLARAELTPYSSVELRQVEVADAARSEAGFEITLAGGSRLRTRMLLLATGVLDEVPEIEGLGPLYGKSVHHCPYCDGWEWRDQPIAAYGRGEDGAGLALGLTVWSDEVVLCTDGPGEVPTHLRERLADAGIEVLEQPITRLEGTEGRLERVVFANGEAMERRALFFATGQRQRCALPARLGCRFTAGGAVDTGFCEATDVPGLFVAGDASRDAQFVIMAAAEGRAQRLRALEAVALLRRVMEEIDVAVFTFDGEHRLRLVNRGGERLLGLPAERLLGRSADGLGLDHCLGGESPRSIDAAFPGGAGRWEVRCSTFRQDGLPHQLLVLSDLSRVLRAEERSAWQRLVRVLGHEINNSLAPIKSIAGSLRSAAERQSWPPDWEQDLRSGLQVIEGRSESLARFMGSYARLARLPQPRLAPVDLGDWVRRVAALETRLEVQVESGPRVTLTADGDQLDQLLINLVRNAADAALETGGGVRLAWRLSPGSVEVLVEDEGPGLPDPGNLFVPFFTTKVNGSGIGLVLSRQIAEAHGGALVLEPRRRFRGARARLRLPLGALQMSQEG